MDGMVVAQTRVISTKSIHWQALVVGDDIVAAQSMKKKLNKNEMVVVMLPCLI